MSSNGKKPKVAIIWSHIPQYRQRFYELLRDHLEQKGMQLTLVYGQPSPNDALKSDAVDLPWGKKSTIHTLLPEGGYFAGSR